jgi:crotonobetaine/carnitine-CoA ligase
VEAALLSHPGLAEVAVHAIPSPVGEDDVKITVVRRAGSALTEAGLADWCRDHLPRYALPRYIEFRQELPRNPVGRVLKRLLREQGVTTSTWDAEGSSGPKLS